jgi:hypothetical protein
VAGIGAALALLLLGEVEVRRGQFASTRGAFRRVAQQLLESAQVPLAPPPRM